MEKLKPCPFCGADVANVTNLLDCENCGNFEEEDICPEYETTGACGKFVVCNVNKGGCGSATGWYPTVYKAIKAWNRRQ